MLNNPQGGENIWFTRERGSEPGKGREGRIPLKGGSAMWFFLIVFLLVAIGVLTWEQVYNTVMGLIELIMGLI